MGGNSELTSTGRHYGSVLYTFIYQQTNCVADGAERVPLYLPTFLPRSCIFAPFSKVQPPPYPLLRSANTTNNLDELSHTRNSTPASPMKSVERLCWLSYQEVLLRRKEKIRENRFQVAAVYAENSRQLQKQNQFSYQQDFRLSSKKQVRTARPAD
jgi:hypothetical protein